MFGKKKSKLAIPEPDLHIQTIPSEFLGGVNPSVQFKDVKKQIIREVPSTPAELAASRLSRQEGKLSNLIKIFTKGRNLLIGAVVLFLLFIVVAALYYWLSSRIKTSTAPVVPAPVQSTVVPEPAVPAAPILEVPSVTEPPVNEPTSIAGATTGNIFITFPGSTLGDTADTDKDSLTDAAEELFKTNPLLPDSDGDKYTDSQEIYNLYDPTSSTLGAHLSDSGLVKEYINQNYQYHLYFPTSWVIGNVDQTGQDVLFSTITGEYVEVRVFDKQPGQNFADWFAQNSPAERYDQLKPFQTAFKNNGVQRGDDLVYYLEDISHWIVLVYHTTESTAVNYRSVITMLARSFRVSTDGTDLPLLISEPAPEIFRSSESVSPTSTL